MKPRRSIHRALAAFAVLPLCAVARVQAAPSYQFTNVADDAGTFADFTNFAVRADGSVAFAATLKNGGAGIYVFNASSGTLQTIADTSGSFGARFTSFGTGVAINDNGNVGFEGTLPDGSDGVFYGDGTKVAPIQQSGYQGYSSPRLNANLAAAYVANAAQFNAQPRPYVLRSNAPGAIPQIIAGYGGTYLDSGTPSSFASFEPPDLNAAGTVVFRASLADGRQGIFTGTGNGDPTSQEVSGGAFLSFGQTPGITTGDVITFWADSSSGSQAVYRFTPSTGNLETVASTSSGAYQQILDRPSINASLNVAFVAVRTNGPVGVYTGADPATSAVIEQGATLFGSRLTGVGDAPDCLSDRGHIAFSYRLADGRHGIALATPGTDPGSSHPTFFNGETALSNGVYYLSFSNGNYFGYYSYLADPKYVYHFDLGYEYVFDAQDGKAGVYLYDFASSTFFYTSPSFPFPYLYDFTLNTVLYYYPDLNNAGHYNTDGTRYFYNFATGQVITK